MFRAVDGDRPCLRRARAPKSPRKRRSATIGRPPTVTSRTSARLVLANASAAVRGCRARPANRPDVRRRSAPPPAACSSRAGASSPFATTRRASTESAACAARISSSRSREPVTRESLPRQRCVHASVGGVEKGAGRNGLAEQKRVRGRTPHQAHPAASSRSHASSASATPCTSTVLAAGSRALRAARTRRQRRIDALRRVDDERASRRRRAKAHRPTSRPVRRGRRPAVPPARRNAPSRTPSPRAPEIGRPSRGRAGCDARRSSRRPADSSARR